MAVNDEKLTITFNQQTRLVIVMAYLMGVNDQRKGSITSDRDELADRVYNVVTASNPNLLNYEEI